MDEEVLLLVYFFSAHIGTFTISLETNNNSRQANFSANTEYQAINFYLLSLTIRVEKLGQRPRFFYSLDT